MKKMPETRKNGCETFGHRNTAVLLKGFPFFVTFRGETLHEETTR
jgi:hypothetical protein